MIHELKKKKNELWISSIRNLIIGQSREDSQKKTRGSKEQKGLVLSIHFSSNGTGPPHFYSPPPPPSPPPPRSSLMGAKNRIVPVPSGR